MSWPFAIVSRLSGSLGLLASSTAPVEEHEADQTLYRTAKEQYSLMRRKREDLESMIEMIRSGQSTLYIATEPDQQSRVGASIEQSRLRGFFDSLRPDTLTPDRLHHLTLLSDSLDEADSARSAWPDTDQRIKRHIISPIINHLQARQDASTTGTGTAPLPSETLDALDQVLPRLRAPSGARWILPSAISSLKIDRGRPSSTSCALTISTRPMLLPVKPANDMPAR